MRFFILIILYSLFAINLVQAQSVKVYSNRGTLIKDANKASQGVKIKDNNPSNFILAYQDGYVTAGASASEIVKKSKSTYKISLKKEVSLPKDYDSKRIVFAKIVDKSGKIRTEAVVVYWGTSPGIDLDDAKYHDAISTVISDWGYNNVGGERSIFKEKQKEPELAIAGEITHITHETKGTPGFKISILVDWSVYDVKREKVIYELTTAGYSNSKKSHKFKGELVLVLQDAIVGLLASDEFMKLADNEGSPFVKDGDIAEVLILPKVSKSNSSNYAEVVKHSINSVVTVKTEFGHGSGFIISEDGYAITNSHVIADADEIEVIFSTKLTLPAEIVTNNPERDVALLKIIGGGYKPLPLKLNRETEEIGAEVIAIGTPEDIELGQTVTKGIVSGYRRLEEKNYIQTDVSINSGDSGGALLNTDGEVIGIIVAKIVGKDVEGLGFAIPIEEAVGGMNIKFE